MYMYAKFRNQIPSSFGGVGVHTDRQTDTHTDRQMRYAINNIDIGMPIRYKLHHSMLLNTISGLFI